MEQPQQFVSQDPGGSEAAAPSTPPGTGQAPPATAAKEWLKSTYSNDPRSKSPALAAVLSMMPGLGQVYVGYYQQGFINIVVIGGVIALLASDALAGATPLFGMFLPFYWLFNMVDAARRATLYNLALQGTSPLTVPEQFEMPGLRGSLFGGSVLIGLGFLLLLHTRFGMPLNWVDEWWPVAPIVFGAYLLYKGIQKRPSSS